MMQANRAFLRRAIRFAVARGVTHFLDIGSGIPTAGKHPRSPGKPIRPPGSCTSTCGPSPSRTAGRSWVMTRPPSSCRPTCGSREAILLDERVRGLLDLDRPVAVLLSPCCMPYPTRTTHVAQSGDVRGAPPSSILLVVSPPGSDGKPPEPAARHQQLYAAADPMAMRTRTRSSPCSRVSAWSSPASCRSSSGIPIPRREGTAEIEWGPRPRRPARVGIRPPALSSRAKTRCGADSTVQTDGQLLRPTCNGRTTDGHHPQPLPQLA